MDESTKLFFQTLKPLSLSVYDRGEISTNIARRLSGSIELDASNQKLADKVESVRFAVRLGVDFTPVEEGNNGTYFGRNRFGEIQLVFKPSDEESTSPNCQKISSRIKKVFFKLFPWLETHSNLHRRNAYMNEVGASVVDKYLGFGLVPEIIFEQFAGLTKKKGSCQLFVPDMEMAQEALGLPSLDFAGFLKRPLQKLWMSLFGSSEPGVMNSTQLEKIAIVDFFTGNQDGHLNNFLIGAGKVAMIDLGLSFPFEPPTTLMSSINQYLAGADGTFKDPLLIDKLDHTGLFTFLKEIMTDEDEEGRQFFGFKDDQEAFMLRRVEIVKAVIAQGKSIAYLGSIITEEDFQCAEKELKIFSSE